MTVNVRLVIEHTKNTIFVNISTEAKTVGEIIGTTKALAIVREVLDDIDNEMKKILGKI